MTRTTNARIAGFTFLFYFAAGVTNMVLTARATGGATIAAKLASIGQHALQLRLTIVLCLLESVCAIVLAATLYAITRNQDRDLALLAMIFRVAEGLFVADSVGGILRWLWLAAAGATNIPNSASVETLGAYLAQAPEGSLAAIFFAMGSTLFAWLFLRGRMIPGGLAWLGIAASVLLVVVLPLQFAGLLGGAWISFLWIPMIAYEVPLGLWLMIKGVPVSTAGELRSEAKA